MKKTFSEYKDKQKTIPCKYFIKKHSGNKLSAVFHLINKT